MAGREIKPKRSRIVTRLCDDSTVFFVPGSGKVLSIWKSLAQNGRRHHMSKKKTSSDGRESQSVHCKHCFINKSRRFSVSSPKQFLSKRTALSSDSGKEKSIGRCSFGFCRRSHKLAPIIELRQTCKHCALISRPRIELRSNAWCEKAVDLLVDSFHCLFRLSTRKIRE